MASSQVKVVVRIRPPVVCQQRTKDEEQDREIPRICCKVLDSSNLEIWNWRDPQKTLQFNADVVYDEVANQGDIYRCSVRPMLGHVLRGQNASVFAYGPTGAGKTYTILGTRARPGIILRCMDSLFKLKKKATESQNCSIEISFSYLEIYQEKVYDLIEKGKDLQIREDGNHKIFVSGLTEVPSSSLKTFVDIFETANSNRKVAATNLNKSSSRSHSLLFIKVVKQLSSEPFTKYTGKLYLLDLAGSEDNRRTGNTGVRLKESGAINSSLFALSKVVDALKQDMPRIPYRDSKLTRLLQDSLGGNAHSLIIANIAPEAASYFDTMNTLKFASKSRTIINRPYTTIDKGTAEKRKNPAKEDDNERPLKKKKDGHPQIVERNSKVSNNITDRQLQVETSDICTKVYQDVKSDIEKRQQEFERNVLSKLTLMERHLAEKGKKENCVKRPVQIVPPLVQPQRLVNPTNHKDIGMPQRQPFADLVQKPRVGTSTKKKASSQRPLIEIEINNETEGSLKLSPSMVKKLDSKLMSILNTGSCQQLTNLRHIGKKRAAKIIEWRDEHNGFKDIDDLCLAGFSAKMIDTLRKSNLINAIEFTA